MSRRTACLISVLATPAAALAQSILGTGFFPGADHTELIGLSAGGGIVVGAAGATDGVGHAYRWAPGSELQDMGRGGAMGVNADGSVVVGFDFFSRAFRWTAATGVQLLGELPGDIYSRANAVSADGTVAVGFSIYLAHFEAVPTGRACRWTLAGVEDLGSFPDRDLLRANAVSADGSVIVGTAELSQGPHDSDRAFRWTAATGIQALGTLGGASIAAAVSADGTVVVGTSTLPSGSDHAFGWTIAGGMQDLGALPGESASSALAVNADGTVIVGAASAAGASHAVLWMRRRGMVDLTTYLPSIGISTAGWELTSARAVSADGRVIAGAGKRGPNWEGWVVTLPCYANCDSSSNPPVLNANDFQCFLNTFAAADAYANCDGSTVAPILNANDFQCFLNEFAAGCT